MVSYWLCVSEQVSWLSKQTLHICKTKIWTKSPKPLLGNVYSRQNSMNFLLLFLFWVEEINILRWELSNHSHLHKLSLIKDETWESRRSLGKGASWRVWEEGGACYGDIMKPDVYFEVHCRVFSVSSWLMFRWGLTVTHGGNPATVEIFTPQHRARAANDSVWDNRLVPCEDLSLVLV